MKRAVLFDLDGTLIDSSHAYFFAEREALTCMGYEGFTAADHARFIGTSMKDMWETFVAERDVQASAGHLLELSNRFISKRCVSRSRCIRTWWHSPSACGVPDSSWPWRPAPLVR
ncbi:HAD family hydrolase [Streptomyces sp. 130]|uniref:HAD hydrolase-like protein n=1 Tax=Streptomyces sp. 130 TaxID=2591006 RepID=UPI00117D343E|nr:HAD hydrolase-like protein [Streptomyces sp. 130]TRV80920.1 HAD family hydrolase [Streptomyces sp. 130]